MGQEGRWVLVILSTKPFILLENEKVPSTTNILIFNNKKKYDEEKDVVQFSAISSDHITHALSIASLDDGLSQSFFLF